MKPQGEDSPRRPIWEWLRLFWTPKIYMYHYKMDMTINVISLSAAQEDTLTTKNGCVLIFH